MRSAKLSCLLVAGAGVGCGSDGPPPPPVSSSACVAPTGAGTTHQGEINASETWTAADSPHIVTFGLSVRQGELTIEPCAVVRIQEGYSITIDGRLGTATLTAHGEVVMNTDGTMTERPVTFIPDTDGTFWGTLLVGPAGFLDLEHVILRRGGSHIAAPNQGGTIVATGSEPNTLTRNVRVVSVAVEDSEGFGVNLQYGAAFTADSNDLTIRGAGQNPSPTNIVTDYPIRIAPPALQTIPSGDYTQNKVDVVSVFNAGYITVDETFRDVGVPHRISGVFSMGPTQTAADGGLTTLNIEAGVTIQMENDQVFSLGASNGDLPENIWPARMIARGTASAPIVFTSASTAAVAGSWRAIYWAGGPALGNVMSFVRIEYAGSAGGTQGFGCGPTRNDAALIFTNWRPGEDFIDNLTVTDSAGGGIVSGWMSDQDGPNFKDGNTFMNIGNMCAVSRWANATNPTCPGNDNVPDCL